MSKFPSFVPHLWEFPFSEGMVLAQPGGQGLYILNQSASIAWNLLALSPDFGHLVASYSAACRISPEIARRDVDSILDSWKELFLPANGFRDVETKTPGIEIRLEASSPLVASRTYRLNDCAIKLRFYDQQSFDEIAPRLHGLRIHSEAEARLKLDIFTDEGFTLVCCDGQILIREENINAARAILLQELVRLTNAQADWLAVVHAGASAGPDGAMLFPASSCSGKTTLMAALMHDGLAVLADDSAPIQRSNYQLVPMPFALMLREGSWPALSSRYPCLEDVPIFERAGQRAKYFNLLEESNPTQVPPVTALVFPKYVPGGLLQVERLGALDTLLRLQESGFSIAQSREDINSFLNWIQSLPAYEMSYGDLDSAVHAVRELMEASKPAR